jgi:hypothetical protein
MKIELIWHWKRSCATYRPTTIGVLKYRWEMVSDKGAMFSKRVLVQVELACGIFKLTTWVLGSY